MKLENQSPLPVVDIQPIEVDLPICGVCKEKINQVRHLDYGEIRLVMHTGPNCMLGVVKSD